MVNENPKRFPIFFAIIAVIVLLIVFLMWIFKGRTGWWAFAKWVLIALAVALVVFLIVLAVWWLFKKMPTDAIFMNKQRVIKACQLNPPAGLQMLYFKGSEEWEYKLIGKVLGVCQIKNYKDELEDCIAFKRGISGLASFFSPVEVVRVLRAERTSLNADRIFLKAMAFTPELFGFYYLPVRFRDTQTIDAEIATEIHRYTLQDLLKEEINIVEDTLAISPQHQKNLQQTQFQTLGISGQPAPAK
jgi:hypothetical protein